MLTSICIVKLAWQGSRVILPVLCYLKNLRNKQTCLPFKLDMKYLSKSYVWLSHCHVKNEVMMSGVRYPKENTHFYMKWQQCKYVILLKSNFDGELNVSIFLTERKSWRGRFQGPAGPICLYAFLTCHVVKCLKYRAWKLASCGSSAMDIVWKLNCCHPMLDA